MKNVIAPTLRLVKFVQEEKVLIGHLLKRQFYYSQDHDA